MMTVTVASAVLPPSVAAQLLSDDPRARVLDVRTPAEFESAHIAGAYNVPLDTLGEHAREITAVTDAPLIVVCQSGQRARKAEDALRTFGMANLHVLDGGVNAWVAAGFDTVRGRKRMSLERQVRIVAGALAALGGFLALFVSPVFAALSALVGSGLVFAGITDTCAMGMLLARLPHNRPAGCDVGAVVRALATGTAPAGRRAADRSAAATSNSCAR